MVLLGNFFSILTILCAVYAGVLHFHQWNQRWSTNSRSQLITIFEFDLIIATGVRRTPSNN
ncbi:hypothetical protein BDV36DRAFT_254376 [Aspergillus pseudocaelatus]|uniref:Uncharacterized protein n=1 Tax=Aspergillus pseudocaelatus TaxID=1825620 RepID=A0ABQ6WPU7_9EURO|nr:hypothetical protein BDV36DRAFT_254376 [Aspergillus pseudocaelatus]